MASCLAAESAVATQLYVVGPTSGLWTSSNSIDTSLLQATHRRRSASPARVVVLPHDMEFHAVEKGVSVNWASVCGASTKRLKVGFSRPGEILVRDRRKWQQLDLVDFDRHGTTPIDAADLHLRSRPEPVRDRDRSVRYSLPKIRAELHAPIVSQAPVAGPECGGPAVVATPVVPTLSRRSMTSSRGASAAGCGARVRYNSPLVGSATDLA
jgi:hypothetical protein